MSDSTLRCHVCGKDIPPADLESLRAITLLKKRYCRDCTEVVTATCKRPPARTTWRRRLVAGFSNLLQR